MNKLVSLPTPTPSSRFHVFTICAPFINGTVDGETAMSLYLKALNTVETLRNCEELIVLASFGQYLPEGKYSPVDSVLAVAKEIGLPENQWSELHRRLSLH